MPDVTVHQFIDLLSKPGKQIPMSSPYYRILITKAVSLIRLRPDHGFGSQTGVSVQAERSEFIEEPGGTPPSGL